jgi:hypothetical protein
VTPSPIRASAAAALACWLTLAPVAPAFAQAQASAPKPAAGNANDLDAFMEKVLKRREVNRQTLQQYILDDTEQFEVLGPGRMPVYRQKREFTWYVRDGLHVRSPVRFDGVAIGDEARKQYEDEWIHRERARLEARAKKDAKEDGKESAKPAPPAATSDAAQDPTAGPSGASPVPTPRFVSEAYFMDFKFEPGNYYLAGREKLENQDVLRIEYYPTRMFDDSNDDKDPSENNDKDKNKPKEKTDKRSQKEQKKEQELEQRIDRQMNKTALVTLWVDPVEHQIVKYTFDNVWMDFLPAGWLVKIDDIRASMTMGQPFPGVWLPREMNIHAGVTMAMGSLEAAYERRFANYKQADVATKIRIPKQEARRHGPAVETPSDVDADRDRGPFVPASSDAQQSASGAPQPQTESAPEVIGEIRVHGNAYLRDDEVIRLAGVAVGQNLAATGIRDIEQRLKSSGFFETVEVRKRYRSLDMTDVALVLLVHERDGMTSETATEQALPSVWARVKHRLMFLPILDYNDGYGFTYGGRVSTVNLLGGGERISAPLTWGGTRRAAVEIERTFKAGPLSRVASTFGIWQRENPHFELDDQRVEWTARAERSFARLVRVGADTSQSTVSFGTLDDRLWTVGADVALDTRGDPGFPRNAVFLSAGWNALHVRRLDQPINRTTTEARGYLGVIGQAVLAGRVQYVAADRTLPDYERLLLGGADNLRGFRTGTFDGDRMLTTSAELRVPITSVLHGAKFGVSAFMDAGKIFDAGQKLEDAAWHQGVGAGVFIIATIVRINLDVAHGLKDGDTRVHLSSGFSF